MPAFGVDELRVIDRLCQRLLRGRLQYGELRLDRDARDFRAEQADEHADALAYMLMREVAEHDARMERLECEAADEMAQALPSVDRALAELAAHDVDALDVGGEA